MGCPKCSARQIVAGGAGYLLAVKGNQGELYANVPDAFQCAAGTERSARHRAVSKGHGRREVRQCRVITDRDELAYINPRGEWPQQRRLSHFLEQLGLNPYAVPAARLTSRRWQHDGDDDAP